jgi:hypothetical protein
MAMIAIPARAVLFLLSRFQASLPGETGRLILFPPFFFWYRSIAGVIIFDILLLPLLCGG